MVKKKINLKEPDKQSVYKRFPDILGAVELIRGYLLLNLLLSKTNRARINFPVDFVRDVAEEMSNIDMHRLNKKTLSSIECSEYEEAFAESFGNYTQEDVAVSTGERGDSIGSLCLLVRSDITIPAVEKGQDYNRVGMDLKIRFNLLEGLQYRDNHDKQLSNFYNSFRKKYPMFADYLQDLALIRQIFYLTNKALLLPVFFEEFEHKKKLIEESDKMLDRLEYDIGGGNYGMNILSMNYGIQNILDKTADPKWRDIPDGAMQNILSSIRDKHVKSVIDDIILGIGEYKKNPPKQDGNSFSYPHPDNEMLWQVHGEQRDAMFFHPTFGEGANVGGAVPGTLPRRVRMEDLLAEPLMVEDEVLDF